MISLLEQEGVTFAQELIRIETVNTGVADTIGDGETRAARFIRDRLVPRRDLVLAFLADEWTRCISARARPLASSRAPRRMPLRRAHPHRARPENRHRRATRS